MKKKHYISDLREIATFTDEHLASMFIHKFRQRFTNTLGLEIEDLPDSINRFKFHIYDLDIPNFNESQDK